MSSHDTRRTPRASGRRFSRPVLGGLVALSLLLGVLATSIFYSMPSNVLSVRDGGPARVFWAKALPQGWAFFTKPPSDGELVAYTVVDGELTYASTTPNSRADNLFGLTRKQRAQGPEIAAMANQLDEWTTCEPGDCLAGVAQEEVVAEVENTSPVPTLCGPTVVVETEPVPFPYRNHYDGWRLDRRYVHFEAVCRD